MIDTSARPRRWWKYALIVACAGLLALLAAVWYTTTDSFQAYVRRRVVAELERITGGHAEIGSFHIIPFRMQVEVRDITVHGTEGPTEIPLAHADSLVAHVKVISFLRAEFGFHSLILGHPVVHIAIAPDGTTNIRRAPDLVQASRQTPVAQLFALSIDHLVVHKGELLWSDQKIPLDFAVDDAGLQMDYSYLRGRYESRVKLGKVDSVFEDLRPFSWMATAEVGLGPSFAEVGSLEWTSGRTHLKASGRISEFQNPHADGNYDLQVDLAEAAAIARRRDLREGSAEFKGSGSWSLNEFATSGSLALRELGWQNEQITLKKAGAQADFSVTDQQIKISKLQGSCLEALLRAMCKWTTGCIAFRRRQPAKPGKGRRKSPSLPPRGPGPRKVRRGNRLACRQERCIFVCAIFQPLR